MSERLCFRDDGSFTIVQFTDTHWHDGGAEDAQTTALMGRVLDVEMPDLVVLTGDVIDGKDCDDPADAWRDCLAPVVERGLAWAAVYGNHDDEGTLSRLDLMAVQQSIPGCLSQRGPEHVSGVGNYTLTVYDRKGQRLAAHLYFIDSNSYAEKLPRVELGGYGWVRRDQIAWYVETSQRLRQENGGSVLPALAFFHIPLPEYVTVWETRLCLGEQHESVCGPLINTGLFAAMVEMGDVLGTFVGHDHVNDYEGELAGIRLCYGRASGYGGYGREGFPRGARVIRLQEGVSGFETWLRLADGERAQQREHAPEG